MTVSLLAVLLVAIGTVVFGPSKVVEAAAVAQVPESEPCLGEAADEADAAAMATRCGAEVEVASEASEVSRMVAQPNRLLRWDQYVIPQRVRRENSWVPVDTNLRVLPGGSLAPIASVLDVRFSGGGMEALVTVAVYVDVLNGVDLRLRATAAGFSHVLVIKSRQAAANPALRQLRFAWSTDGLTLAEGDEPGSLVLRRGEHTVLASLPAMMWDSNRAAPDLQAATFGVQATADGSGDPAGAESSPETPGDFARIADVGVALEGERMLLVPDVTLLEDPDTVFPLYIDPAWPSTLMRWFYANNNGNNRSDGIARVGANPDGSGLYRSLFEFKLGDGIKYRPVYKAVFYSVLMHSSSCVGTQVSLWEGPGISTSYSSGSRIAWSAAGLTSHLDERYGNANESDPSPCSGGVQPDVEMQFNGNLTQKVKEWTGSGWGSTVLALSTRNVSGDGESNTYYWKKFSPSQTRLTIWYNDPPSVSNVKVADKCAGSCASPTTVRVLNPPLQATVSDVDGTDGDRMTVDFEVWNSAKTQVVASKQYTNQSNSTITWTTPNLENTKQYHFRVQATDSHGAASGWSAWSTFTVNTAGPGRPTNVIAAADCYGACSSPAMLRNARPTFKATVSHPFGDSLTVTFEVWNAAKTTMVTSGSKSSVAAGTTPTWQPASNLAQNQQMHLRVKSTDTYSRVSAWSAWYTFTVDQTAPGLPGVDSPLYTDKNTSGGTYNGGVGIPGAFTFTPGTNSTDVVEYQWKINGGTPMSVNVAAGASANVTITPAADLKQLLQVQAVDAAGWSSGWQAYPFLVRPQAVDAAYWKLDGTTASVSGGSAYTGMLSGAPVYVDSAISPNNPAGSGKGLQLDGVDDFMAAPKVLATDHVAGFSVSAWAKPSVLSNYRTVAAQQGANTYAFRIYYKPETNRWCFSVRDSDSASAGTFGVCSDRTPQVGVWTHLVGVYDPVVGKIRLYVNGGPENGQPDPGTTNEANAPALWSANGAFRIGRSDGGAYFNGVVDEVRAYQRALPEVEARQMFLSCLQSSCPQPETAADPVKECLNKTAPMCVGEWKLDDNTGTTASDSSEQNNMLTFNGSAAWTTLGYNGTSGVTLDGATGYLTSSRPIVLTDQSYSVSVWVKPDALPGDVYLLQQSGTGGSSLVLKYYAAANAWLFVTSSHDGSALAWHAAGPSAPAKVGVWTHLVGVYDASTRQIRLYVNGQLAASTSNAVSQASLAGTGFMVGGQSWGAVLDGTIDLVRAYQGALSDAQVAQLFVEQLAPPKLMAWWELEEFGEPTVADSSPNGNTGTLSAAGATWTEDGHDSLAVTFDGVSGSIEASGPVLLTTDSVSVAAWVNLSATGSGHQFVLSQAGQSSSAVKLFWNPSDGKWVFQVRSPGSPDGWVTVRSDTVAELNTWVHLVGVFDAATGQVRLYVNGQKQTMVGAGATGETSLYPFIVGAGKGSSGYGNFFTGTIDAIRAYQGALSDAQAAKVFQGLDI